MVSGRLGGFLKDLWILDVMGRSRPLWSLDPPNPPEDA